jgi:hypothetical protein
LSLDSQTTRRDQSIAVEAAKAVEVVKTVRGDQKLSDETTRPIKAVKAVKVVEVVKQQGATR